MTLVSGARLGPYEIISPLGAGGMGEVYRARDVRLDRDVAVKVLPEALFGDADLVARFEREAKALAALNHPGIAAIHSFEEVGSRHLLVQELLVGETLRQALASGKLPLRKTLDFAVQIAKALAAAHEKGVVHRDLKPENLFVTSDGRVKILDFGLAKLTKPDEGSPATNLPTVSRGTEPGVVLGTLGYMSPEQVRGKPADARSDIFSFGAVLYEMLSGKKAFSGDSAADTMSAILKEEPPELAITNQSTPPGLERIVRHCLEKSPEQRFHSAHDLAFDLEALSAVSTPRLAPGRARRRPSRALVVASGAALALGLLAGRLVFRTPLPAPARYHRLTFRRGFISSARFAPDGQTIVYSAAWDGARTRHLYSTRAESPESATLALPERDLRAISRTGEMLLLELRKHEDGNSSAGTLSQAPLSGSAARDLMEDVAEADWSPDGRLAVVHAPGWRYRLEFPLGKVLYEATGWISHPRVSPKGDAIAFLDHPLLGDDAGSVAVVDLDGKMRTLSAGWVSAQGVAWSPTGEEIWFSATRSGSARNLQAVTLSGRQRTVASAAAGMMLSDVSKDGRVLFIEQDKRLGLLSLLPGESGDRDLSALDWPVQPILSRDGRTLVFSEEGAGAGRNYTVYLRRLGGAASPPGLDGSAAVRLGTGHAMDLSPDGRWVLAGRMDSVPSPIQLIPTGAGSPKPFPEDALHHEYGKFFPDGRRILFNGSEPRRPQRTFVQDLEGGAARPVTPEGITALLPSADGTSVVVPAADGRLKLVALEGGATTPIAGTEPGDVPLAWAEDLRSLFVRDASWDSPARVFRVDGASGRRDVWKELTPGNSTGLTFIQPSAISADGKTIVFHTRTSLSTLYVAEGMK